MGYMALTTHLRPSNYSVGYKRLECVSSNNSNHRRRALSIESDDTQISITTSRRHFLSNSNIILDIQNHNTIIAV